MYCYTHLEDFIRNLYINIGITKIEQLNIYTISRRLKLKVIYAPFKSFCNGNMICIDSRISKERQWQEFIHELCHFLLHSGNQLGVPPAFRQYQEWKAENFTYQACVPTYMLDELCNIHKLRLSVQMIQVLFNVEEHIAIKRFEQYTEKRRFIIKIV
ncbi:ImmA/IrrE family metallo-endopeptidase [Viridibacillus arvi]|uniref:ImmA/IrrE family metallo-endopeptidase n=1 Tax=Viridibacillus arvi TaxID=263475 RepID=UPI003D2BE642